MSAPNEDNVSQPQLSAHVFDELLDSIIIDVASECHRVAKLGLDRNLEEEEEELRLYAEARARVADPSNSSETNGKYIVDIFGQTHPRVANEIFERMKSIMSGRFAPQLEKCMGKGRKARLLKATRSSTASIHEEVLLQPTLLIQIPPARVDYQTEVPVFQVMNTRMAP